MRDPIATLLVVDDSRTNLGVIGRRLAQCGYLTALCDNGADALDLIAARGFDLVLLDMTMPLMSGVQVLRAIRQARASADLPVIMLTGRSDPAAAVEALAAGADDHIAKPFAFEALTARIARVLARARRIAALECTAAARDATRADRRLLASIQALNGAVAGIGATLR